MQLSDGQLEATQWFGLPPVVWGWIALGLAVLALLVLALIKHPRWAEPAHDPQPISTWARRGWTAAIVCAGTSLHAMGLTGGFNIFDDQRQIHWEKVTTELTSEHLWLTAFGNFKGTSQELMYLSFQANWALAGKEYWGWFIFNLAALPLMMLLVSRMTWRLSGDRLAALLAMALFATTPLLAEVLGWMSARSHLLGLFFGLITCVAWLEYISVKGKRRVAWLLLSLLAFGLTQISKPVFLFLPGWLILFDVYMRRKDWKLALVDKLGHVLIAGLFTYRIVVTGAGQRLIKPKPLGGSYLNTAYQDFNLLVEYGRTLLWPTETGLLPAYNIATGPFTVEGVPQVLVNGFAPLASLGILVVVFMVALVLRTRFGWGMPMLWLVASAATLATVLNIPYRGHAATFEYRYTLSAQLMTAIFLGSAFAALLRSKLSRGRLRWLPVALVAGYLTYAGLVTNDNRAAWSTSYSFWARNAELYPQNFHANYYAGKAAQHKSKNYHAVQYLLQADKVDTTNDLALRKRLGDNYYYTGDYEKAKVEWTYYFKRKRSSITDKYRDRFETVGLDMKELSYRRLPVRGD